ncbi:MAG: dihydroxy-acid dehydratase [Cytophagales bacterium]|tara:strand:- start:3500 stop:5164 length:1665 start_codon:yes stop_codon:yes gene_type:complete
MKLNKFSRKITQDESLPAAQAMLYGIGLKDDDFKKAQIGIASTGFEGNPCNMHLNDLALQIKKSISDEDLVGLIFNTIGVSDGITNGTKGMTYSLISREIIADSIETIVNAQFYDGLISVVGCDKNMPGAMMAIGRLNRPSILVYGGTIKSGKYKDQSLNIVSAFEAYGQKIKGKISEEEYKGIIKNSIPGPGACGGMYTANTMSSAIEALGMSLPFSSSNPAESNNKLSETQTIGKSIYNLLKEDIRPKDIMTRKAFENALSIIMVLGGSTNAVLHIIAMANSVGVEVSLDDFQNFSDKTPLIANLKPSGDFLMEDLHNMGGTPALMKYMLENGYLHGDCLTVTGKTLEENLISVKNSIDTKIIKSFEKPIKNSGHIQVLYGNIAPEGAVAKITGKEGEVFEGHAKVYENEFEAIKGIENEVKKGDVIVIKNSGPKGGPGMPEMLKPTSAVIGAGLGKDVALITDGRFSGGSHGFVVGHITPESYDGGPICIIRNNDKIIIDAKNNKIDLKIDKKEFDKRINSLKLQSNNKYKGVVKKYINSVSSASKGCITD